MLDFNVVQRAFVTEELAIVVFAVDLGFIDRDDGETLFVSFCSGNVNGVFIADINKIDCCCDVREEWL